MIQSPNDPKTYLPITLANGLRVLIVQNQESEKSAAALVVNAGHFNDPLDRQGLAHFLEHLLFLGTEKYPNGSEYQQFISQYAGSNNAWTATEHTCFFFDIHHQHFEQALARFSQFFISPLLSDEFIHKERQNIDAEFKLKLKDDIRRLYDVHKETINPKHPFAKFSVGDIDTLNDRKDNCLRDEVLQFYQHYYRAGYMTLAIEGPQSIDELTTLAQQYFSAIKPSEKPLPTITEPLYLPEHLAINIEVKPVKNERKLIVSFAMPSIDEFYAHKPESILSYLLGYEGKGSILSLLKQKQWALALTAGSGINGSNFKDFNISLSLTELGEKHLNEIVDVIFSYINLLKKSSLPEFYYEEKQAIADISFQFYEQSSPLDSVCQLALNMQHYPEEDYIYGDYKMTAMDHQAIQYLLNFLSPDNMRIIHISQQTPETIFEHTSFWYQVPYNVKQISNEKLSYWQTIATPKTLFLPHKNPFIVKKPQVLASNSDTLIPIQIVNNNGLRVWFKQDISFKSPKGHIYIGIDSPLAVFSTKTIAMNKLFSLLYSDTVVEDNYDAELAGIHYHTYAHQGGLTLQLSGLSEKQPLLLTRLLTSLTLFQCSKQQFKLFKTQLLNNWQNSTNNKSISQLFSKLSSALQPQNPSSKALIKALEQVSFQEFIQFSQSYFNNVAIDVLIHGNWHAEHAQNIANLLANTFNENVDENNRIDCPVRNITEQKDIFVPLILPEHDHASVVYYPFQQRDLKTTAITMLLSQLFSPAFFQEMRTEKQYGYLVGVGYIPINRYPGIAFYIQSPETKALTLVEETLTFIEQTKAISENLPEQHWQHLKQGLAGQLQEKDTSLRIKSQRFWASICNQDYQFNRKEALIEQILQLTINDINQFIEQCLLNTATPDRIILTSLKSMPINLSEHSFTNNIKSVEDFNQLGLLDNN